MTAPLDIGTAAAVILDMDGVVTDTASVHEAAWTQLFDAYLSARGEDQQPFDSEDYRRYVDGRARIDGVVGFLGSREIEVPRGDPVDAPASPTAWGLANRKNDLFIEAIERHGVRAFPGTVDLLQKLKANDRRVGVVTASRNAGRILAAAGVADLFDVRVDGTEAERAGLAGKPDPAMFLEAARRLEASPQRSVVIEDALAGVEAGRRGRFGLVVGVDRVGQADALRHAGADVVVADLSELPLHERLLRTD